MDNQLKIKNLMEQAIELGIFDSSFYSQQHGLAFNSEIEAFQDYVSRSWFSDTSPSKKFDGVLYMNANQDVYNSGSSPLIHYIESGKKEGRAIFPLRNLWTPKSQIHINSKNISFKEKKFAIVLHVFYADFIGIFANALLNVDFDCDIYLTSPSEDIVNLANKIFSQNSKIKKIKSKLTPNRGRNFGPFLIEFSKDLLNYDYICHLHSKKSLHSGRDQEHWAAYLLEYLLNDKKILSDVISIFENNADMGLYYPTSFWRMPTWVNHWLKNKNQGNDYLKKEFDIDTPKDFFAYPVGGMFWAKIDAIRELLEKKWSYDDFPPEPIPADGTFLHVLERVIPFYVFKRNYKQFFYSPSIGKFTIDDSFIFAPYRHQGKQHLENLVKNYKIISFDLFDTLAKRDHFFPDFAKSKVPEFLKLDITPSQFVKIRNEAEFLLRKNKNWQGDVSLIDIYKEVAKAIPSNFTYEDFVNAEFDCDIAMISGKKQMISLLNLMASEDKLIYIITDSYYSKLQIAKILRKIGVYCKCKIYVSSEMNARKDSGEIWKVIESELSKDYIKTEFVHIGDSVCSDAQNPGDLGLAHFHILNPLDKWAALNLNVPKMSVSDPGTIIKYGPLLSQVGDNPFLY